MTEIEYNRAPWDLDGIFCRRLIDLNGELGIIIRRYHMLMFLRNLCAGGIKGQRQEIDLLSLSIPDYVYRGAHPALCHLQKMLCHYIVDQYSQYLEQQVQTFTIFVVIFTVFL